MTVQQTGHRRRNIVLGAVALIVVLGIIGSVASSGGPTPAETAAGTTLAKNVRDTLASEDWYSALTIDASGLPTVTVTNGGGGEAIVSFAAAARMDHAPVAMTACQAIAALAHDPATAAALPISSVVITANGDNAAQCFTRP